MERNKLISLAIAFALLAVSFAMVESRHTVFFDSARAASDANSTTNLTVNARFPKMYWTGFNETVTLPPIIDPASLMGTQVAVNTDYLFTFTYNYSFGWSNCSFFIQCWYDKNAAPSYYPGADGGNRTLAFEIRVIPPGDPLADPWWPATLLYPTGAPNEMSVPGPAYVELDSQPIPGEPDQDIYRAYVPIHFGPQMRATRFGGNNAYNATRNVALVTPDTWDFSVSVADIGNPTARSTHYGEFGVQSYVAVQVTGTPSGNAPPGGSTGWIDQRSVITYSSNAPYFVNVSLDDHLYLNGVWHATDRIDVSNVTVLNEHLDANALNSNISIPQNLQGPTIERSIWGNNSIPLQPPNNGTWSAGPNQTDHSAGGAVSTPLAWMVMVNAGIPEGIYWAVIRITIDTTF